MEFTATQDFYSEETRSQYCKGFSYTARRVEELDLSGVDETQARVVEERCAALAKLLPQWVAEGKVVYGRAAPAMVSAQGKAK